MKRAVWLRDGGLCCHCNNLVDLYDSELDHRIALQFAPLFNLDNEAVNNARNLWTLCKQCHADKSARELLMNEPDPLSMALPEPLPLDKCTGLAAYIS